MRIQDILGARRGSADRPREPLRLTPRLVVAAAVELLAALVLVWTFSRLVGTRGSTTAIDATKHAAPPCVAGCGSSAWYWAAAGTLSLSAVITAGMLAQRAAFRHAIFVLLGGVIGAAAVCPPIMRGAQVSQLVFMVQLQVLAVIAPVLVIYGIRVRWLGTRVSDALAMLGPFAAVHCAVTMVLVFLPVVRTAMLQSAAIHVVIVVAIASMASLVWLSALGSDSPGTVRRRVIAVLIAQEPMALIGLVLLGSPIVLYAPYGSGSHPLAPLFDQRAAGAVALAIDLLVTVPILLRLWAQADVAKDTATDPELSERSE